MREMFKTFDSGRLILANRFVFPPVKTAYGTPDGRVTDRHLTFYRQIAENGPGLLILEPVAVTAGGKEHPRQLCVHLPDSVDELKKIVDTIHTADRRACLHLNHAGAAANPRAAGAPPKAPSAIACPTTGQTATPLTTGEIEAIVAGYRAAAEKAVTAGFDVIEIQGGHGYLVSQFLNGKINQRDDEYGHDRTKFAEEVISAVLKGAGDVPCLLRISGSEMSPEFGISQEDLLSLLALAEKKKIAAIHVGMGSACFSPPWYFHHGSLPEKPQWDALKWVRMHTKLPLIAAGRMGRAEQVEMLINQNLADLVALGRPLLSDPDLVEKWKTGNTDDVNDCGYCLQGCLHRVKTGRPLGCNLNPEIGKPPMGKTSNPRKVLVAGGGPAGMSAAVYLVKRGHQVTLVEKEDRLGGQFRLAWQAPGKQEMLDGLAHLEKRVQTGVGSVMTGQSVDAELIGSVQPDLLVWATGAVQNIPDIDGLGDQYTMTSLEYFKKEKPVKGPRVLVIGAGRTGLEIAEKLGKDGYEVVATKRTDPIGSMMEMITRKLILMRIEKMPNVTLMPHTTVLQLGEDVAQVDQDGEKISLGAFQTIILASGMRSAPGPEEKIRQKVAEVDVIGDADQVMDIFTAIHAGYETALKY
ncbi:MAG: NADH:flavin oxidoreductase [Deltaproteobacteria bacterium]|nr:MAG: NADH:flavin oxidoreductase [Deltaproteobacteria bacterium]